MNISPHTIYLLSSISSGIDRLTERLIDRCRMTIIFTVDIAMNEEFHFVTMCLSHKSHISHLISSGKYIQYDYNVDFVHCGHDNI